MHDAQAFGANLRAARDRIGLNQHEVAKNLGIPRSAVSNMESGERAVSAKELAQLSALYRLPVASFFEDHDLSTVLPRALPSVQNHPEMWENVERIKDLCADGAALRSSLGLICDELLPDYGSKLTTTAEAIRQAEHVSQEERRRLGIGNSPIGNIAELLTNQGVWTAATHLPEDVSGFFISHPSIGMAIVSNAWERTLRRRFSLAHEFAHALFDRGQKVSTTTKSNSSELAEKRANAFAAAFLMPSEGMREQIRLLGKGSPSRHAQVFFSAVFDEAVETEIRPPVGSQSITFQDVTVLARHFGVSYDAVVWRLKSLTEVNRSEAEALFRQRDTAKRYRELLNWSDEHEAGEGVLEGQIAMLAVEAYRRKAITLDRLEELAEKVGMDPAELVFVADAAVSEGQDKDGGDHSRHELRAKAAGARSDRFIVGASQRIPGLRRRDLVPSKKMP